MHTYCLINGKITNTSEPIVKINDLGLLRGYGVFDFFPVIELEPVFFNDYWKRFRNSAMKMHLPFDGDQDQFHHQLRELFEKNRIQDGYCKLLLTGGYSSNGFSPDGTPNFIVITQGPILYPRTQFSEGIKLITVDYTRDHPEIKSINYMTVLIAQDRLREEKAEDVLYISGNTITESSRSNFFIIDQDGILKTPKDNILAGITRGKVIELARELMEVKVTDVSIKEIKTARSAFITSTTKGILPVSQIDDTIINNGEIHPIVHKMQNVLAEKINNYIDERVRK